MSENPEVRRFLTVDQVAEELNVSGVQIRALLRSGELKGIQIGGRGIWRIGTNDVQDYITEAYRRTATLVVGEGLRAATTDNAG